MDDIVAYCNLDRYQSTNRGDSALYDPDSKVYQAVSDPTFQSCKSGVAIAGVRRPMAMTNNYRNLQKVASMGVLRRLEEASNNHEPYSLRRLISVLGT